MQFPTRRLRRLRKTAKMRSLVRETTLLPSDLVCPVFVQEGINERVTVRSMPGMQRLPLSDVTGEVESIKSAGIPAIMLFGLPSSKDDAGSSAFDRDGIVQRAASEVSRAFGDDIVIMSDVCLCQYTLSGHCGVIRDGHDRSGGGSPVIDNDSSLEVLAKIAVSQAESGVDVVAPSAMMDGQVSAIRTALDDSGFSDVLVMSHSAKHRSGFYSPFRDAAECAPQFGDRSTYQMPYTNAREAMMEVETDVEEGADIVMIKPALAYLDLVAEARRRLDLPVAAYSTSGEYALVRAAAAAGYVDGTQIALEMLTSIKRAGADIIVTYFAKDVAGSLLAE
ncbi:MAG: porphobilinogen synthase [Thaumarchaeota archaeon]|nr:porphobilinogen synthase [Nitrososphaerota archaeon]MDE0265909.1 porphobilinogen synthase [Nitrososphaerota archaeon]MDE0525384.1 porphobilinogen synthase [Nitrososphaerota archaeon]